MRVFPENEIQRLNKLYSLELKNLGKDQEFEIFAEAACYMSQSPMALIALMDDHTQYVQSCIGLDIDQVNREDTVCQYTLLQKEILIIPDTRTDARTMNNAILRAGNINFYAGIPLITDDGFAIGTLCILDYLPKVLNEQQVTSLQKLSQAILQVYVNKKGKVHAGYYSQIYQLTNNMILVLDNDLRIKNANPSFENAFKLSKNAIKGKSFLEVFNPEKIEINRPFESYIQNPIEESFTTRTQTDDGHTVVVEWNIKHEPKLNEIFCFGRNITKEFEEKLKLENSERKFRNFFENAIGLMTMHDLEGNLISVNEKGRTLLKYEEEEISNYNLSNLVPAHHRPLLDEYLKRIAINKEDSGMMVLLSKDGQETHWMFNNMLETDPDGKPFVMSTALNMTERIKLEKDLLYTKQMLEQTNQVAQVGGWEYNFSTNTLYWSETTKLIHGVSLDYEPDIQRAFDFYEPESHKIVKQLLERAIQKGETYDTELQLIKHDGEQIWVRIQGKPEMDGQKCRRIFGIIQDINQSKLTYLNLQQQEAMLRSFIMYVPAAVAMLDKELNFISTSNQWREDFTRGNENLENQSLYDLFPDLADHRKQIYLDALEGKSYKNYKEIISLAWFSEPQHYHWEVRPWLYADGQIGGVIVSALNNTKSIQINEELKNAKQMADIASKAKSQFLANMSHEIRTPLNGVIGFSDLLLKTPLNEIQKQYLNYINESGNSLLQIINDILDFSKIEAGKLELYIGKYDLYELANQVINVILYQAQKKNIELLLNVEQGLPSIISVDESRVKQVLINLLGNAVKFTDKGEIELSIEKVKQTPELLTLRFTVRDTGIGIPIDKQQRIFDAFTQEDSSVSKRYGGTGLGLTISNNILKYMKSNLSLISTPKVGSSFYFDLEIPYEYSPANQTETLPFERVLIVDDNEKNRIIMQHMLQFKNVDSTLATNGLEALQILMKGEKFDAILMDYHMPILSGLETIDKIRDLFKAQQKETPLIVLHTSSEESDAFSSFMKNDKSFCLLKPIKSDELYATLRQATYQTPQQVPIPATQNEKLAYTNDLQVLLADDNPVNMALNLRIMGNIMPNAVLSQAADGLQAIDLCQKIKFDLILMDVQMPEIDGLEATRKIRTMPGYSNVPIIGITAGNVLGEKEKCLASGMSDFSPKPIRQSDLKEVIFKFFESENTPESISIVEHWDLNAFDEQVGGDPDFETTFLGIIQQELTNASIKIEKNINFENKVEARAVLHKLKGTAGTAGLFKIAEIARDAEESIIQNKNVKAHFIAINREIRISLKLIQQKIHQK